DVDPAGHALLELPDDTGVVRPDDLGVLPCRLLQRGGDHVLHGVVHERRPGIVGSGPGRPGRLEHLIRGTPEQDPLAAAHDAAERRAHLGVKAKLEAPRRLADYAVEGDELVHPDTAHDSASWRVTRGWLLRPPS